MHPKVTLTRWLKLIGVDARQALVGIILGSLVVAYGGLLLLSEAALNYSILLLTIQMPLWATISLVLLAYLYTRRKFQQVRSLPSPEPTISYQPKIIFFSIDNFLWKTKIYEQDNFSFIVSGIPYCKQHDLSLILKDSYYVCPELLKNNCNSRIYDSNLSAARVHAESYIEKEVRNISNSMSKTKEINL